MDGKHSITQKPGKRWYSLISATNTTKEFKVGDSSVINVSIKREKIPKCWMIRVVVTALGG